MSDNMVSRLQLKTLLLDSVTYFKHKRHLVRNHRNFKIEYCELLGISNGISNKNLIKHIGRTYKENGLEADFVQVMNKFDMPGEFKIIEEE